MNLKHILMLIVLGVFLIGCAPQTEPSATTNNDGVYTGSREGYNNTGGAVPYSFFVIEEMPCVRTPYGISCDWTKWQGQQPQP